MTATGAVTKRRTPGRARYSVNAFLDGFFFVFAAVASLWLATLLVGEGFSQNWWSLLYLLAFWALLAYLVLPRIHRILTTIYVPDYFIGRARTSDGLLGDPVNLALLGTADEVHEAMAAAGWTLADGISAGSTWRIITSTITRRSYDEAPVSPLMLFGRQQDFAYQQEVAGNPAKRHHVRFWRCPDGWMLPGGSRVDWLAAGTFDRAVGFSLFTLQVTHKIDADTDIERDHIVRTLEETGLARVHMLRDFSTGYHSRNGGGDSIQTDGDLPVVALGATAVHPAPAATAARNSEGDARPEGKRASFESGMRLAERGAQPVVMRRPVTTSVGSVLVALRVLAGSLWLVQLAAEWPQIVAEVTGTDGAALAPADADAGLWFVVAVGAAVLAIELGVVYFVWAGRNWARLGVLIVATLSILVAAGDFFVLGEGITIETTLLTLSLDILVLLALSSRSARAYARRPRGRALRKSQRQAG